MPSYLGTNAGITSSVKRDSFKLVSYFCIVIDAIMWPVRPRARFHCKTIKKIPVRDGASRAGKSRPALLGSRTALIRGFYQ